MSEPERYTTVSLHAVEQYRRRRRDGRHFHLVEQEIVGKVREAIRAGRVANHKTEGFGLYGEKRRQLPTGERFIWTEEGEMGWIIKRTSNEDVVVTTLTRSGQQRRVAR